MSRSIGIDEGCTHRWQDVESYGGAVIARQCDVCLIYHPVGRCSGCGREQATLRVLVAAKSRKQRDGSVKSTPAASYCNEACQRMAGRDPLRRAS